MTDAVVHSYAESDLDVWGWDESAVATYRWEMDWEMVDERRMKRGRGLFVFERVTDR